jgi:pentapeptide MXKDX repeat protein
MKKLASLFAVVLALAVTGHAHAQDKMSGGKMSGGKMADSKMSGGKMAPAETKSYTGPVKGAPGKSSFILAMKSGPMMVDTSKAKVRMNGKFTKMDTVKGGSMVTVTGMLKGTTFMADTVTVKSLPGGKKVGEMKMSSPSSAKMGAGKSK